MLTQARLKELLHYDPETGVFTWRVNRGPARIGNVAGCRGAGGAKYLVIRIDYVLHTAHRLAWLYMTGEWPALDLDHRDLDGLNNRWANLREATGAQNKANRKVQDRTRSGRKGVYSTASGKWRSAITVDKKHIYLGTFLTKDGAALAYQWAAERYFGEYARAA